MCLTNFGPRSTWNGGPWSWNEFQTRSVRRRHIGLSVWVPPEMWSKGVEARSSFARIGDASFEGRSVCNWFRSAWKQASKKTFSASQASWCRLLLKAAHQFCRKYIVIGLKTHLVLDGAAESRSMSWWSKHSAHSVNWWSAGKLCKRHFVHARKFWSLESIASTALL